jgi:hypothetical protein
VILLDKGRKPNASQNMRLPGAGLGAINRSLSTTYRDGLELPMIAFRFDESGTQPPWSRFP